MIAFSTLALLAEASRVIELRLQMIASGRVTTQEMLLMVTEKAQAMDHAGRIIARGGSLGAVIDNYRRIVATNLERLSPAKIQDALNE
jgi:hypothetical protein